MFLAGRGLGAGTEGRHRHSPGVPQIMEVAEAGNQTGLLVINIKYLISSLVKGDYIYFVMFARGA